MNIPRPPASYDQRTEQERNRAIEQADQLNLKKNEDLRIISPVRLIMDSPDGTEWVITVDNTGAFAATSL